MGRVISIKSHRGIVVKYPRVNPTKVTFLNQIVIESHTLTIDQMQRLQEFVAEELDGEISFHSKDQDKINVTYIALEPLPHLIRNFQKLG